MRLRNKKTGEIIDDGYVRETHDFQFDGQDHVLAVFKGNGHRPPERVSGGYSSLAELNEEWEDYEEPKVGYIIDPMGGYYLLAEDLVYGKQGIERAKELGIWAETEEEVKQLAEKLKAWKRLKDKGFDIYSWEYEFTTADQPSQAIILKATAIDHANEDLDLLFGGEE